MKDSRRTALRKQSDYQIMEESPGPGTWSASMPGYCYTKQCPAPELRELPEGSREYILRGGGAGADPKEGYEIE